MLKLILGPDRQENSRELLARVCAEAKAGRGGLVVIVPEQFSHETERALVQAGGDSISRYAEVLSFSRLANRVFSLCGGVCEEYLDEGGRLLTMYLAVQQVLPQIKYFAAACSRPEFLKRLCAAMEEFMSCCLSPESLFEAAGQTTGSFAQKLTELGLLLESYLAVCKTGRQDPVTRLLRLGELLEKEPYARGRRFYLDGFSDFTAAEARIVSALLAQADEVTAALTTDGSESGVFRTAGETRQKLLKAAAHANVPAEERMLSMSEDRSAEDAWWLSRLFAPGAEPYPGQAERIHLLRAGSPEEECRLTACKVRELTKRDFRLREICVAASDGDIYAPILRAVFSRAGLPCYLAGSEDILKKPLFPAILAAMQAVERYDSDEVLRYLKSGFSSLEPDAVDRLERYARQWNIRGMAWEKAWEFHPQGYGQEWDENTRAELNQLNIWRESAVAPLRRLRKAWKAAPNVEALVMALYDFLEDIGLQETLQEQTDELYRQGSRQAGQQMQQLAEILLDAMEQTVQVLGRCVMPPEQFTQLFRMLLGCYRVSSIPATLDEAQLGGLPAFRHRSARVLFILGAEDGKLPSFSAPLGILTDEERIKLLSLGLTLSPERQSQVDRELGWICGALSCGTEEIYLSCSSEQPSFLYEKTRLLFPGVPIESAEDSLFLPDLRGAAAAILSRGGAAPDSPVLLQCLYELQKRRDYRFLPLSRETVQGLYGENLRLSASRVDQFAACKYAAFLSCGLKARPWKTAKFDAPVFGTFVHYVLECTVRELQAAGGFEKVSEEELKTVAQKYADEYTKKFLPDLDARGERFSYLYRRNLDEVLSVAADVGRELRASSFVPADEELSFAENGSLPPVTIKGKEGSGLLSGAVDRVDLFNLNGKTYFRIVDYKTGRKDFDYAAILNGEGLQMLIYLFTLQKYGARRYGKDLQPAGVLYVPARVELERVEPGRTEDAAAARTESRRRKGLVLGDEAILNAMEKTDGQPEYLPVKRKKDGISGDLASKQQLEALEQYVMRTLSGMTDRILQGDVTPDPIIRGPQKSSCRFCDFADACHRDSCERKNRYIAAVRPEKFWEEIERGLRDE
jgi:ATP-dependent helicase/nuclease subunit B